MSPGTYTSSATDCYTGRYCWVRRLPVRSEHPGCHYDKTIILISTGDTTNPFILLPFNVVNDSGILYGIGVSDN